MFKEFVPKLIFTMSFDSNLYFLRHFTPLIGGVGNISGSITQSRRGLEIFFENFFLRGTSPLFYPFFS